MFSSFGKAFGTTFGILCGVQAFTICRKKFLDYQAQLDNERIVREMKEKEDAAEQAASA